MISDRWASRVASTLAVIACAASSARPAHAQQAPASSPLAIGLGTVGMAPAAITLPIFLITEKETYKTRLFPYMVTSFVVGGLGLGLGGGVVAVQAMQTGKCASDCQAGYGLGGAAIGLGAFGVLMGALIRVDWVRAGRPMALLPGRSSSGRRAVPSPRLASRGRGCDRRDRSARVNFRPPFPSSPPRIP